MYKYNCSYYDVQEASLANRPYSSIFLTFYMKQMHWKLERGSDWISPSFQLEINIEIPVGSQFICLKAD